MSAIITRVSMSRNTHAVYISYMDGEQQTTLILDPPEIVELFVKSKAKDDMLKRLEWSAGRLGGGHCPVCRLSSTHAPNCELVALIEKAKPKTEVHHDRG